MLKKLQLVQERDDARASLQRLEAREDLTKLEKEFVQVARAYSDRRGIRYAAWRAIGVKPEVLDKAGIARSGAVLLAEDAPAQSTARASRGAGKRTAAKRTTGSARGRKRS
jgi:hypothetical protein